VAGGDVYFSWGEDDPPHGISHVSASAVNATPQVVATMNPRSVRPVLAGGRVFALDYGDPVSIGSTRDGGVWALDAGGASHVTHESFGAIFSVGSIATYNGDLYVRGGSGLVRYASTITASSPATPTTIIDKSSCDIDGYDVSSTVAIDASGIYIACLPSSSSDYELRKYSSAGVLQKILGTSPNSGYGFVTNLRLTSGYAYWMGYVSNWAVYRAPK
jgi:hypothetical protein